MFVYVSPHLSVRHDGVWHAITFADARNGTPAAVCGVAPPAWETDRVTPDGEAVIAPWPPYARDGPGRRSPRVPGGLTVGEVITVRYSGADRRLASVAEMRADGTPLWQRTVVGDNLDVLIEQVVARCRGRADYYQPTWCTPGDTLRNLLHRFEEATGEPLRILKMSPYIEGAEWWDDQYTDGLWRPVDIPDRLLDDEIPLSSLALWGWSDTWTAFLGSHDDELCLYWVPRDPTNRQPSHPE